jgi:tRNA (uracil-5-)-methyltransferase TRM9
MNTRIYGSKSNSPPESSEVQCANESTTAVYQRYYHLFVKGELEDLVKEAGGLNIEMAGFDRDNWFVIGVKI